MFYSDKSVWSTHGVIYFSLSVVCHQQTLDTRLIHKLCVTCDWYWPPPLYYVTTVSYIHIYIYTCYVYIYVYIYINTYLYVYIYICYIYIYIYVYVYMYMYIYVFIHVYIHIYRNQICVVTRMSAVLPHSQLGVTEDVYPPNTCTTI